MTSGAWKCRQRDDGLKSWFAPRENEKPFTDSERAQRWRLSLASLLFLTVLLSDHLWFCAEAKRTRTRDKEPDKLALMNTNAYPSANHKPNLHLAHSRIRRNGDPIFIVNSTKHLWRLETCYPDSLSKDCFTFVNADHLCRSLSEIEGTRLLNLSDLYLSFCNSYSLLDLLYGSSSPDNLTCSVDVIMDGDINRCSLCVQAFQRYDQHAQEKFEEFELMAGKYETDVYSVRTCLDECKMVYKPWLCAQYFQTSRDCRRRVPCVQYCLEVQQRCPFILPDNDDLIHGGTPSFICAGQLSGEPQTEQEPGCCDVRWAPTLGNRSLPQGTTLKRTHPSCHRSAAPRLGQGRLKLCLLVLVLLHTVASITAAQNSTSGLVAIFPLEDNSAPQEE